MHTSRALVLISLLLAACGGGGSASTPTAPSAGGATGGSTGGTSTGSTTNAIGVSDNAFGPAATTVVPGTTVTWTWGGSNPHNVAFDDGIKSATQSGGTYTRTFATAGTYPYHCTIHGTSMSGVVTVK